VQQREVALTLCAAEVLAMAGTMTFQALIPTFIGEWQLSHTEAGWISGAAYAGYMAGVPLLVSLTDRIDARRIVLLFALLASLSSLGFALFASGVWSALAFRVLNGLALAGTYMPGLKALTDRVEGPRLSRYQSLYTATFSVGTSLSLLQAGLIGDWLGWRAAFAAAGIAPLLAAALMAWQLRPLPPPAAERTEQRVGVETRRRPDGRRGRAELAERAAEQCPEGERDDERRSGDQTGRAPLHVSASSAAAPRFGPGRSARGRPGRHAGQGFCRPLVLSNPDFGSAT